MDIIVVLGGVIIVAIAAICGMAIVGIKHQPDSARDFVLVAMGCVVGVSLFGGALMYDSQATEPAFSVTVGD